LGFLLLGFLYLADPRPTFWYAVVAAAMLVFLVYLPALKLRVHFEWLLFFAAQYFGVFVLLIVVLFGGISSPFMPWFGAVILTGSLYLGGSRRLRNILIASAVAELLAVYFLSFAGVRFTPLAPMPLLDNVGALSDFCLVLYIMSLVFNFVDIVAANQSELQDEINSRRRTEAQLIEARERAEQAARSKAAFLANTSHELRTPLNAIIGFSDVIRSETFGALQNARYREYLDDIAISAQHLLRIINDILDLSKFEAGKGTLDGEEPIDLGAMIDAAQRMVRTQAHQAGIELVLIKTNMPPVLGNEQMLKQVLLNLASNAVKFTPRGGRVTIRSWRCDGGGAAIAVCDTGIGMNQDDIGVALTAFGQIDSAMGRRFAGTGLGLPLAKAMVELHQGRLEIESAPGRGTAVTMVLPPQRVLERSDVAA